MEDNKVEIRDRMDHLLVPFESITAVHPTAVGAHVTPIIGEMRGKKFTVKVFKDNQCAVRLTGGKRVKKPQDPLYLISELVEVMA